MGKLVKKVSSTGRKSQKLKVSSTGAPQNAPLKETLQILLYWTFFNEFSHVLKTLSFKIPTLYCRLCFFNEFPHVLRTLSFYKLFLYQTGDFAFLRISVCTDDFAFLQFSLCIGDFEVSRVFPCTGDFEFLQTSLLYQELYILQICPFTGNLSFTIPPCTGDFEFFTHFPTIARTLRF